MTDTQKLATASYIESVEVTPNWTQSTGEPEKMKITDNYKDQLKICKFYANKDPIASGVISKQVDLGFNGYMPKRQECTDEEFSVYSSINDLILSTLRTMAREYLISGLLVPEITWKSVTGKELGMKGRPNKSYTIPDSIWLRDPTTIDLKPSPIPTKVRVFVTVPPDDIYFIQNNGKYKDGTEDRELYKQLEENYPEYVKLVKDGKIKILLNQAFILRRSVESGNLWPTPYLLPALESLNHKRNLKKMDYAIAARVIGAIQVVTLGSDKFPLTEDDQPVIDELKNQMVWRNKAENIERVFQLFGNHTLAISWVTPPTEALLDTKKYDQVNKDILYCLGIPAIITYGETERSASSSAEFALLPPTEVLKSLRKDLSPFIYEVYKQIKEKNSFINLAEPGFPPIKLYDPAKAATVGKQYHDSGALSQTTWDALIDVDFENEQILRKYESEVKEKLGVDPQPLVPFSSPAIGPKNPKNNGENPNSGKENNNSDSKN